MDCMAVLAPVPVPCCRDGGIGVGAGDGRRLAVPFSVSTLGKWGWRRGDGVGLGLGLGGGRSFRSGMVWRQGGFGSPIIGQGWRLCGREGERRRRGMAMAQIGALDGIKEALVAFPPTWESSLVATATVVVLGSPVLLSGLTVPGVLSAYVLGTLSWRAFGPTGFFIVALYFVLGTAATKVKIKQKESEGIAEQRRGRRGPASVWGSGTAGCLCALAAIWGIGGPELAPVWALGFVASFCTKISDTVSSEIGKAYGKNTYLVTTLSIVPRGTEGAVSLEGTLAGVLAASVLAGVSVILHETDLQGAAICVLASQLANLCESYVGATLQGKEGYEWLNNDIVNIFNISIGAALAIAAKLQLG